MTVSQQPGQARHLTPDQRENVRILRQMTGFPECPRKKATDHRGSANHARIALNGRGFGVNGRQDCGKAKFDVSRPQLGSPLSQNCTLMSSRSVALRNQTRLPGFREAGFATLLESIPKDPNYGRCGPQRPLAPFTRVVNASTIYNMNDQKLKDAPNRYRTDAGEAPLRGLSVRHSAREN